MIKSRIIFSIILSGIFIFIILTENSLAYKVSTHRIITGYALKKSENYNRFKSEFNIDGSLSMQGGSELEDGESEVDRRWFNHYYDPINQRGLNISGVSYGRISKDWGYNGGSGPSGYSKSNNYSWTKAREYMHIALTGLDFNNNLIASTQDARNKYFQSMFRSVGQVTHLVQDLAQPSHVRNDPHVSHGEAPILPYLLNPSHLEDWAQNNGSFIGSYASSAGTPRNYSLYDSYFITLASITNTNFFSDDTIFKNYYYPSREQTDFDKFTFINFLSIVVDEDGKISKSVYITKTGGALTGYKAAQAGYFWKDISSHVIGGLSSLQFQIDDKVAEENAKVLIPKAVEYSAGLLNYFFRGQMEANGEAAKDGSGNITGITIKVKNLTSNEDMRDGNFVVSYKYKPTGSNEYVYGLSDKQYFGTISYNNDPENYKYTFNFPAQNPIPKDAADVQYILVFQGTLGSETGAVVGRVVTLACGGDIWEDWECGFTGKHPWAKWGELNFEVVDGFGDNTSKVLRASAPSVIGSYYGYILHLQTPVERPKKVSFDYYVKSSGVEWDFGWIFLFLYSKSEMIADEVWIAPPKWSLGCWTSTRQFDGLRYKGCNYRVEKDRWVHVEQDLLPGTGKIENIGLGISGYTVSSSNPFEVYIDNIDFKY